MVHGLVHAWLTSPASSSESSALLELIQWCSKHAWVGCWQFLLVTICLLSLCSTALAWQQSQHVARTSGTDWMMQQAWTILMLAVWIGYFLATDLAGWHLFQWRLSMFLIMLCHVGITRSKVNIFVHTYRCACGSNEAVGQPRLLARAMPGLWLWRCQRLTTHTM